MPASLSSNETQKIVLTIRHPVPSLNALFGMSHWARLREKKKIQAAFAYALLALGEDSSTRTTWPPSILSTASDMLASFGMTGRKTSSSKSARKRSKAKPTNAPSSKSSPLIDDMTRTELVEAYWANCRRSWNRLAFNVFVQTLSDSDLRQYIQMGTT